ncbi:hypothetical protein LCGC14_1824120 [marine sediment metagenome]|uniref:Tyr recombinase domain-containing protein n=1 Tax=marine sediment metagenome TaxID=412755 RepID=A0A0F9H683_9ZZZZ
MFYIEEFLNYLKSKQYCFSTLQTYKQELNHFKEYCIRYGIEDVKNTTKQMTFRYLATLHGTEIPTKAYCNRITKLIKYFRYLEDEGLIFLSPFRDYSLPKYHGKNYPVIEKAEMENILSNMNTDDPLCIRGKAIIELAYSSALRPREIYGLKIPDIEFERGLLFIEQSKNKKDRIVPVGKTALYWMKRYIREVRPRYIGDNNHSYVFISHRGGEKLTVWGVRWAIQESLLRSGLKPIKPYSLRGTAATQLLLNGMNVIHISKLLGHSRIETTQYYLRVDLKKLKKEIQAKHPRERMKKYLKDKEENHEV